MTEADTRRSRPFTVCHFGHHDPSYARNRILAKALQRTGAEVVQLSDRRPFARRAPGLLAAALHGDFDLILVGYPGNADVLPARLAGRQRRIPVVLDAFVSLWDSAVVDRKDVRAGSLAAARYRAEDKVSCRLADLVLLDTASHIDFFVDELRLPPAKFRRVWIGADDDVMYPRVERAVRMPGGRSDDFTVFFYGSFLPLHGIEWIVRAAWMLELRGEQVRFVVAGSGPGSEAIHALAACLAVESVTFLGDVPYDELPVLMAQSDVCLGIFGTTPKAHRVIPNKVFDALACARAVVTADTVAARECLVHGQHAWLCPPGNAEALANVILELRDRPSARQCLAEAGYELFRQRFSIDAISELMKGVLADAAACRHDSEQRPQIKQEIA